MLGAHIRFIMRYLAFFIIIAMTSCNNDVENFYRTSRDSDLWVLPLIKPYRLINAEPNQTLWYLDLKRPLGINPGSKWKQVTVDKINVVNKVIYGSGYDPAYYFVIVPDEDIEKVFKAQDEWNAYLKELGINGEDLRDVLTVYDAFNEDYRKLPWYDQVEK